MTITFKVLTFPSFPISKQLFTASGKAFEAGMTAGGVRMLSPEPGGRAMLEIQPSLQVNEWDFPASSWLMSKINGDIFKVRLAPTPQVAASRTPRLWSNSQPWSNQQKWAGDAIAFYRSVALQGSNVVTVDMLALGRVLQLGHVIGHGDNCYLVDEIKYNDYTNLATITVNPPLRRNVNVGDIAFLRPYFLGSIMNGDEMRATYDAVNNGHIQLGVIKLGEVML